MAHHSLGSSHVLFQQSHRLQTNRSYFQKITPKVVMRCTALQCNDSMRHHSQTSRATSVSSASLKHTCCGPEYEKISAESPKTWQWMLKPGRDLEESYNVKHEWHGAILQIIYLVYETNHYIYCSVNTGHIQGIAVTAYYHPSQNDGNELTSGNDNHVL